MKLRSWTVTAPQQVVMTPDGPLVAQKGTVLTVVVAESWDETAREIVRFLDGKDRGGKA